MSATVDERPTPTVEPQATIDAVARSYDALHNALVDRLRRMVGGARAEDAVQELFMRLLRTGPGDASRLTFSYLFVCARRIAARMAQRDDARRRIAESAAPELPVLDFMEPQGESQEACLVFEMLRGLSRREWDVVQLTVLGSLTNEQAAESLGLPASTVRGLRQRAMARIREQFTARQVHAA
ncbi:MAG: RNA polymerase sigma factor [Planctomycetota bacterium]|nr:RNA polymerase sigma factor [Planctomycetota bacterium]MDA1105790.1 RNA polymerase sigma factor [Planctomycetota bacterium]